MKAWLLMASLSVALSAATSQELYQKCAACHGKKGEKKALGKSQVIAGWKEAKTLEALKGYKAGKRNVAGMGALMKGQVVAMSDADLKTLSKYISTLKK